MRRPRISIAGLMIVVVVVALNCAAIQTLFRLMGGPRAEPLIIGALPMANILAIGIVRLGRSRRWAGRSRLFLLGFVAGGISAMIYFIASALSDPAGVD